MRKYCNKNKANTEHITKAGCSLTALILLNKNKEKIDMSSDFEPWPEVQFMSTQYTFARKPR